MAKAPIDWASVEKEYRAGSMSVRALAEWAGCSEGAIRKRAKKEGWKKDLTADVKRATREQMLAADAEGATSDEEVVDSVARTRVQVVREHRKAIKDAQGVALLLLSELQRHTMTVDQLEEAIEIMCLKDDNGKREAMLMKAVSLPSRASAMKQLSAALKDLVTLERQAHSLDDKDKDDTPRDHVPLEDRLNAYKQRKAVEEAKRTGKVAELPQKQTG